MLVARKKGRGGEDVSRTGKKSRQVRDYTYTRKRTSKRAAPSLRSAMVVTGLESLKVVKKSKNASTSLRNESPIFQLSVYKPLACRLCTALGR